MKKIKKLNKIIIIIFSIVAFLISICFIPINASKFIPLLEESVSEELGVDVHVDRLIMRVGPYLKIKAPTMALTFENGQKFAQFDNVKFYISWLSILKNKPELSKLQSRKLNIDLLSDDMYLIDLIKKLNSKEIKSIPNTRINTYNISYFNKSTRDKYFLEGSFLELLKIANCNSFQLVTVGNLGINSTKYVNYDLRINPQFDLPSFEEDFNFEEILKQIKELDFHSDIIADVKLYKNFDNILQASGFINIDNISVLDYAKKQPKSFIYLTLWGDKASVLSNIYTSDSKKVYLEGMINNTKKTTVDLKVKTDDIDLKDLYQKISIVSNFSGLKNIKQINGKLNANFTLKGDLNKIKSNGFLKIADANINMTGFNIAKINSEIDFSNNAVNIVKAVGYVQDAPIILKGKIDKNLNLELLMNKVELKHLFPESYCVKNGTASIIADFTGPINNVIHKENISVENLAILNDTFDLKLDSIKYDTNKNNTIYVNNITCKTPETELIKIPSMKFLVEKDLVKIPETSIFMPNSKLSFKGEASNFAKDLTFTSMVDGFINSKDIIRFNNNSTRYPLKLIYCGNKTNQTLYSQVLLEKTDVLEEPAILNVNAKLDKNNLKIEDLSLVSFSGKFLDDLKGNLKGAKKVLVTGVVENIKNEPVLKNLRFFIPQQLNVHLYDTVLQLKGDLFVNGEFELPEIVGQLTIQNLLNQPLQLAVSNCTLDFNKNNIILNAPVFKIADTSMAVNALLANDFTKEIVVKSLNIKSKFLNTDTLLMYKDAPAMKKQDVKILDGKFYSEKILSNVYTSPVYLSEFSSNLTMENSVMNLKNITSEVFNGKLAGNLSYNLKNEMFDTDIMIRNVSAAPVFDIILPKKESISGVMNVDAKLSGELTSKQSLNGNVKFTVNNGRMATLGKLEHLLYAQNVIADNMLRTSLSVVMKAITLKDTGLFKYLQGDIDIVDGVANIKMLQSQGPLMALFMKGQYNPMNDYAKLTVLGRLSDEVVAGLGVFGDFSLNKLAVMLTGEEIKRNILPEDIEKLPQLSMKNTKEFMSIIDGVADKTSSVKMFNWISYSQKSLIQKEVPMTDAVVPDFVDKIPY